VPHARSGSPRNSSSRSRRGLLRLAAGGALAATFGLAGCAAPVRGPAVPRCRGTAATVLGVTNERFLPGTGLPALDREFIAALERQRASLGLGASAPLPQQNLLAISGGGENGAFGAGLLCGWSAAGTRPQFSLVTGVSTGALTAPFAFLGPDYDAQLRSVYTDITLRDVAETRGYLAAIFDDALADTLPLFRTISRYLDVPMMAAIARGHDEGRMLLIGTTDIDAQIPVTWNIGAIAKSGHPQALDLVRRILLASAAIPGAFPPVMVDMQVAGERFQEMHVDGGAVNQAFLYPAAVTRGRRERMRRGESVLPARVYVIRNARLDPDWAAVERRTLQISARAISTMIAVSGYNDVLRLWVNAERDGMDFNLAYIGADFTREYTAPFEQAYMRALFEHGFAQAQGGFRWAKVPPLVEGPSPTGGAGR